MSQNSEQMSQKVRQRIVWILSGLGGLAALAMLAGIPGEGLSLPRLVLMAVLLLGSVISFLGALQLWQKQPLVLAWEKKLWGAWWLPIGLWVGLGVGWLGMFLPDYWLGRWAAYGERLRPLALWLGWVSLLAVFNRFNLAKSLALAWQAMRAEPRRFWLSILVTMLILVFVASVGIVTGLGVEADDRFWNEAGVPVLGVQVLACWLAAWVTWKIFLRWGIGGRGRWLTILVGGGLWLAAVVAWWLAPMLPSYFAPGPYPPSNEFYPYSDAAVYDVGAQYVLLGQGILNGNYMDKPLYVALLAGFHALAGQAYDKVIFVQILVLALWPLAIFALGKKLHGPGLGVFLGLLVVFRERNAMAVVLDIQVSHAKLMMAEVPVAWVLTALAWAGVCWLQNAQHGRRWAILAGAIAGAAVLIRPNALLAVAVLGGIWLLARMGIGWRQKLVQFGLFGMTFAVCFLPWMMNVPRGMTKPYLVLKAEQIIETRYQTPTDGNGHDNLVLNKGNDSLGMKLLSHWLHNEWLTVLSLPNTLALKDLSHTVQAPYWQDVRSWDGRLGVEQGVLTWFNLGLIAIGIGEAWKRWRWAGLVPLGMQVGYFVANGLARNSGARYLVAVDWVTLVYYALGLLVIGGWLMAQWKPDLAGEDKSVDVVSKGWLILACVVMALCASLPVWDDWLPNRYADQLDRTALWQRLQADGLLAEVGMDSQEGRTYFEQALVVQGRAIYPRFYYHDQGEPRSPSSGTSPLTMFYSRPYPRLTWILLSNDFYRFVMLPMAGPTARLPDAVDMVVVGCPGPNWFSVDAMMIFILEPEPQVLLRSPQVDWGCPVPEPVCNQNRNCR